MIKITKEKEPEAWKKLRKTPGAGYQAIPELRTALLKEQGYICAYCMSRVSEKESKIEHIKPQSRYPDLSLDYDNMVICCMGNLKDTPHCDTSKGDLEVTFDLYEAHLQESISYSSGDGSIKSSNENWKKEMNEILNLNHGLLKLNRVQALEGAMESLNKKGPWAPKDIRTILSKWQSKDKEGKYKEYCGIVIFYLKKKLKQKQLLPE